MILGFEYEKKHIVKSDKAAEGNFLHLQLQIVLNPEILLGVVTKLHIAGSCLPSQPVRDKIPQYFLIF